MQMDDGRRRVVIEGVEPQIDCGRYPIKRVVGEDVTVEADIFADGHDAVAAALLYRPETQSTWAESPMEPAGNDRFRGRFTVNEIGRYVYTIIAWVDAFGTWRQDLEKRVAAGQDVTVDLRIGEALVAGAAESPEVPPSIAGRLRDRARLLGDDSVPPTARTELALSVELATLMAASPDRRFATRYAPEMAVVVDRERARFSAWYELFPRSASPVPGRHGTFRDVEARLPYVAGMGFDVLYLPPIHPIGERFRKGPNNSPEAGPGDVGSPWAIGSSAGGHTAVHPELGTLEDFERLVEAAQRHGLEIALDIAFQTSPDHPYVREHPEWFRQRPDGTIQYAENPPKKYQDIYPFDFETDAWRELWEELTGVVRFWTERGVRIFRVDNPHTKPFGLWEYLIGRIKAEYPDVLFLSEAFTRPKVMYRLAKLGFTQSYTYFAWRNGKQEIIDYATELTRAPVRDFFRPNFWPNTPDILTARLQTGDRAAFEQRLILAALLAANYGIYGPAFELMEHRPREAGSEEYLNSEKYQLRHWDVDRPDSLRPLITLVNRIRRANPALQSDRGLRFHRIDNDQLLAFSKATEDLSNVIVVVVNLDARGVHSGWVELPPESLGLPENEPYLMHDLLTGRRYQWHGRWNYVQLGHEAPPAHVFRVAGSGYGRTEREFETY